MVDTQSTTDADLASRLRQVFGTASDPMPVVEQRAREAFPDRPVIVWEGDASTFQCSYVGQAAEQLLGYPCHRWTDEPSFWVETVVHEEDRSEAIAHYALATGQCKDHDFVYRAVTADGRVVWLHDVVKVIVGDTGIAQRLRGVLLDVSSSRDVSVE